MRKTTRFGSVTIRFLAMWFGVAVWGWAAGAGDSAPAGAAMTVSPEEAMRKSLEQQAAAIDAFRENLQKNSISKQLDSIRKQAAGAHMVMTPASSEPLTGSPASQPQTATATAIPSVQPVPMQEQPNTFFATDWPTSAPLSVPNVRLSDESCEALERPEVDKLIGDASKKNGVNPDLLRAVMKQESAFKPCAVSVAGAMGLMQIMPDTADSLGLDDPFDPAKNVDAGARFLKMMLDRYQGDVPMALGAYNAGPGRVDKAGGVPPIAETVQYISNVLGDMPVGY